MKNYQLKTLIAIVLLVILMVAYIASEGKQSRAHDLVPSNPGIWTHKEILSAIRWVESRHVESPPRGKAGEIGPYQILPAYWLDATRFDAALGGEWRDCAGRSYSEKIVYAYMARYFPHAWRNRDAQTIARAHNGGPRGPWKRATYGYWLRVKKFLRARRSDERRAR